MTRRAFSLIVTLSFALGSGSAFAELQDDMDEAEFRAAGLHKLSEAELASLNRWLNKAPEAPQAPTLPATRPAVSAEEPSVNEVTEFGQEQLEVPVAAEIPTAITARLQGEFRGWDGKTIFRLDNGQIWQQRVGGKYRSSKLVDPEVELVKGRFGYYMEILSSGRSVGVKRIR